MPKDDLYELLGVNRTAADAEIKKAYRRLARELHPDRNKGNLVAEEKFKKVSAAYAVLSDKHKRQLYDEFGVDGLRDGFSPSMYRRYASGGPTERRKGGGRGEGVDESEFGGFSGFGALEDIFETLFGKGRENNPKGRAQAQRAQEARNDKEKRRVELEVEFLDAVVGREMNIQVNLDGKTKKLKVTIPKGVENGNVLRLKGQGAPGDTGLTAGDLQIVIKVREDKRYERQGMNLRKKERVTIGQAYHGGQLAVETPWGKVNLSLPPKSQSGQQLRLKGQGIRTEKGNGDLYIVILVKVPTSGRAEEGKLIDQLEKMYTPGME
jgi:curved DNA-binding protein